MSAHLGFESYQIPLGSSLTDMYNTIKTAITSRGWQVIGSSEGMMIQQVLATSTWHDVSYVRGNCWDGVLSSGATQSSAITATLSATPFWSGVQFVAPVDVRKIWLHFRWNEAIADYPSAFSLDYSDDGVGWTALQSWGSITIKDLVVKEFIVTNASAGAHSFWRINVTAKASGWCGINEITLFDASGRYSVPNGWMYLDLVPPVSEVIGDSNGYDFCRLQFTTTNIGLTPKVKYPNGFKQAFEYVSFATGNNIPSITINGQTVAVSAGLINAGNTAMINAQLMYDTLVNSANSTFTDYTWEWLTDYSPCIVGTKKTSGTHLTTATNCTAVYLARECPAGINGDSYAWLEDNAYNPQTKVLSCDLTNGFVYYLQINARTIGFATKTNVSYFGPAFLSYTDHAQAISEMPGDKRYVTPLELFLVRGPEAASHHQNSQTFLNTAKVRGRRNYTTDRGLDNWFQSFASPFHPACYAHGHVAMEVDAKPFYSWVSFVDTNSLNDGITAQTIFGGFNFGWGQLISRGSLHSITSRGGIHRGVDTATWCSQFLPPFSLPDVKRHITNGAVTNENALMSPDKNVTTQLVSQINLADTPTTIAVVDASQLPTVGAVSIQGEIWKYTSKSGNSLVGCTRAQYSTTARVLYAGAAIHPIAWYIKINDFALAAGYTRP